MGRPKGCIPWNKGIPCSEETKRKISESHIGNRHSEETKRKMRLSHLGEKNSQWGKCRPDLAARNRANARYPKINEEHAREIFEQYKTSGLKLVDFGKQNHMCNASLGKLFHKFMPAEYEDYVESKLNTGKMYKRGRNFEYRVRDHFRSKGYFVLRSPRSSGPADLVAIKHGEVLFIQCKSNPYLPKKEEEALIVIAESVGASPIFAFKEKERGPIKLKILSYNDSKEGMF